MGDDDDDAEGRRTLSFHSRFVYNHFHSTDDDDDADDSDDSDTFAALGEELFAGFFDDETTKKPVVAAVVPAVVVPAAPVAAVAPAKAPEILSNEIIPVVVSEVPVAVIPVETVAPGGEKLAEQVSDLETAATMPEKVDVLPGTVNEVLPVVDGVILEPAASEIAVSEVPAVVASAATAPEATVAAVAASPVKQASEEEEGLIEGIVNTLILDDGEGSF